MKRGLALLLPLAFAACQDAEAPLAPPGTDLASPSFSQSQAGEVIPGQYIVVFNDGVADAPSLARRLTAAHGGSLRFTYEHAIKGFAAQLSDAAVAALRNNSNVAYIEQDQVVHAVGSGSQSNATWGIDRVDQRDLPLNESYGYATSGAGVNAYIIDSGILISHSEFGGRASHGYDYVDNDSDATDCNGHGTHVAGTVGGTTYGVAQDVKLIGLRVLDCRGSGTTSGVIAGVDWVTKYHTKPAVANMSLGGGASDALDTSVRNSIAAGVTYGLAAGNGDRLGRPQDACAVSPSRVTEGLTVGATDSTDVEASFSNYGTCVDILAPGVKITSAWYQSDTQLNTISGTSMATPHVVGAAAAYLESNPGASPAAVADALTKNASANKIKLHRQSATYGTPNLLLYTAFIGGGGGGTTNSPPTASFTQSCRDLSCDFTDTSTDSDGTIASWSWNFGDNTTSTAQNPSHSYAAGGTYNVQLTVTDNAGGTSTTSQSVTVTAPSTGGISLSARGYKVKGSKKVDLSWSGATSNSVDVYRDSVKITTTANDGAYTDIINSRGGGSYTYKICEAGTSTSCSNSTSVTF